jgi:hypothetical protein
MCRVWVLLSLMSHGRRGFFLRRSSGRIQTLTIYLHVVMKAKKDRSRTSIRNNIQGAVVSEMRYSLQVFSNNKNEYPIDSDK